MRIFRLFNEKEGKQYLRAIGVSQENIAPLELLGISGISNLLSAIKTAKYFEMTSDDIIMTLATDSADMYQSRLEELKMERGEYKNIQAIKDFEKCLLGTTTDYIKELTYTDRKMLHNLKYFTWVEQQAKDIEDLNQLWYDRDIWNQIFHQDVKLDEMINEFNEETGVLKNL